MYSSELKENHPGDTHIEVDEEHEDLAKRSLSPVFLSVVQTLFLST